MTNQASEDKQTKAIYEAMQIHYLSERHDAIKSLLRTEKLKLLAEVRERVVGRNQPLPKRGDVDPDIYVEVIHRVEGRNALRAEQINLLTKLEAEL